MENKIKNEDKITSEMVINIWWSFVWRYALCLFLFMVGLGILFKAIGLSASGVSYSLITTVISIIVSIWAIKNSLIKM